MLRPWNGAYLTNMSRSNATPKATANGLAIDITPNDDGLPGIASL